MELQAWGSVPTVPCRAPASQPPTVLCARGVSEDGQYRLPITVSSAGFLNTHFLLINRFFFSEFQTYVEHKTYLSTIQLESSLAVAAFFPLRAPVVQKTPGHLSFHDSRVFSVFPLPAPRCREEEAVPLGMRTPRGQGVPGMCYTWPTDSGSRSDINSQKRQLMQRPHQRGNGQELMRLSMRSNWKSLGNRKQWVKEKTLENFRIHKNSPEYSYAMCLVRAFTIHRPIASPL